jgi:hypothetical protein
VIQYKDINNLADLRYEHMDQPIKWISQLHIQRNITDLCPKNAGKNAHRSIMFFPNRVVLGGIEKAPVSCEPWKPPTTKCFGRIEAWKIRLI